MTTLQHKLQHFVKIFNKRMSYNLVDLVMVDHPDGTIHLYHDSQLILCTKSFFRAYAKSVLIFNNETK